VEAFFDFFAQILSFFYDLVPNYSVSIIMLTLAVMIVVTPLTLKGTRSMMVMQQLQPEIKKIQTQFKDDRQRLNEELLKFYKENNLNPLGGCLPLLVQAPVFIVLYQVLRGLTRRDSGLGFDLGWVTGDTGLGQVASTPPEIVRAFDPAYLHTDSAMYESLHQSTTMSGPLGIDLALSPSQALSDGIISALPYLVLIAIVGATGFIQQRQIQGRNPNAQINPQQQAIMRLLPIFLPVISFTLPTGLVLYFAVSNIYRIGQQAFISRSIYGMKRGDKDAREPKGDKGAREPKGDKGAKGPRDDNVIEAREAAPKGAKRGRPADGGDDAKEGVRGTKAKAAGKGEAKPKAGSGRASKQPSSTRAQKPGRVTPKAGQGNGNGSQTPTLQPRARKNKKR
jgi:YidC/Oxa1 family membrane protein insertase